jgi:thioredoxin-dependent peroxiredoxin
MTVAFKSITLIMNLAVHQSAPDFTTTDVYGNSVQLKKLTGKKVYLAFERNVGCPVCNLRFHELQKKASSFANQNITVVMVYESSLEKMKEYLGDAAYPFQFIADPENKLYRLYNVQRSTGKLLRSLLSGLISKALAGKKLFKKPISQDGHTNTIPSEFLIDESGKLSLIHHGRFVGDHLPIESLVKQ